MKRFLKITTFVLLLIFMSAIGLFFAVKWGAFGKLPTLAHLKALENSYASEVVATRGETVGKYFTINRSEVRFEEIPTPVIQALVATEDVRFYEHSGVDTKSFFRVIFKSLLLNKKSSGGGSTLTQQLVKNIYGRSSGGKTQLLIDKIKEQIIAKKLEQVYTKDELITLYLNTVPFGENVYGIETAAYRFFKKPTKHLKTEEGAVLIGMLKANTTYNPKRHPEAAKQRRDVVISQMQKALFIADAVADSLKALPLTIRYQQTTDENNAPYFLDFIRPELIAILNEIERETGVSYDLQTDGLRIETTLDFDMQQAANAAIRKHLNVLQKQVYAVSKKNPPWSKHPNWFQSQEQKLAAQYPEGATIQKPTKLYQYGTFTDTLLSPIDSLKIALQQLHAGLITTDVRTGAIKAWVGGIDHATFPYNLVLAERQVGSTYKPFVFLAALENNFEPCDYHSNEWVAYEEYDNWAPQNYDKKYDGAYSMGGALAKSINTVTAAVAISVGLEEVVATASRLTIPKPSEITPALALGAQEISLYQMNQAYSAIANGGKLHKQYAIERIIDRSGAILYSRNPVSPETVIEKDQAEILRYLLEKVVTHGTAASCRSFGVKGHYGGKTGTTSNYSDGWFIGFNNKYSTAVWVGHQYPVLSMPSYIGSSTKTALPIWSYYTVSMEKSKQHSHAFTQRMPAIGSDLLHQLDCADFIETDSFWDWLLDKEDDGEREMPTTDTKTKKRRNTGKSFWDRLFGR
ncbi:MAG: penicillin-binding protein [Schleiferiaceae bacterium]|nr:penicillin-binding protein [Schleiferiaceae bacterium]